MLTMTMMVGRISVVLASTMTNGETDAADAMEFALSDMSQARGYSRDLMPEWPTTPDDELEPETVRCPVITKVRL